MSTTVRYSAEGDVGVITLDRPPVNAISSELVADLENAVVAAEDPAVRAAVVTGEPHFAAGADLKAFLAALDAGGNPAAVAEDLSRVLVRLERLPKPVIAAVKGFAIGGGLELALACDFRYLAEDARCGQGEMALGIFPGAGGTQRLPRLIGIGPARDLIYTGRQVDAAEALRLGIADEVYPADELMPAAMAVAQRFAAGPTASLGLAKRVMNDGLGRPLEEGLQMESEAFVEAFATDDAREGVSAFLEKREARFSGR